MAIRDIFLLLFVTFAFPVHIVACALFFFRFVLTFVLCVCGYGAIGIRCGKTVPVVDMSIRCELIWKKNTTEIGKGEREREGGRKRKTNIE